MCKRILLAVALLSCMVVGISAATVNTSGGAGAAEVSTTADAAAFNVTVPTRVIIHVDADGHVTVGDGGCIVNNCAAPVEIKSATVTTKSGFRLVEFDSGSMKIGDRKFALRLNDSVCNPTTGAIDTTNRYRFPILPGGNSLDLNWKAQVPAQKENVTATDIACVTFVVGLHEAETLLELTLSNRSIWKPVTGSTGSVNIPSTFTGTDGKRYRVTAIGSDAFNGCTGLQSVVIPATATSIGGAAFGSCTNLTHVTIPEGVTFIGTYAFYNCTSLTEITFPSTVTHCLDSVFYGCSKLQHVTILSTRPGLETSTWDTETHSHTPWFGDGAPSTCKFTVNGITYNSPTELQNSTDSIFKDAPVYGLEVEWGGMTFSP